MIKQIIQNMMAHSSNKSPEYYKNFYKPSVDMVFPFVTEKYIYNGIISWYILDIIEGDSSGVALVDCTIKFPDGSLMSLMETIYFKKYDEWKIIDVFISPTTKYNADNIN